MHLYKKYEVFLPQRSLFELLGLCFNTNIHLLGKRTSLVLIPFLYLQALSAPAQ